MTAAAARAFRTQASRAGLFLALATALALASPARAGQIRVNLVGTAFSPDNISVNLGDHIVWVWLAGTHNVVQGSGPVPTGTEIFNSGDAVPPGSDGSNTTFSWQADRQETINYFCEPHWAVGMVGTILVLGPGSVPVADFRITEVLYNDAGGADRIEITNMGNATGNLGRYRLAIPGDVEGVPLAGVTVVPGAIVVLNPDRSGSNSASNVFMPALSALPDAAGSVALYVPNTHNTSLADATQIVDFVQWGAGGQANEATAVSANRWTAGEFIPTVGTAGRSIEFCGMVSERGASHWAEVAVPNFGTDANCATPNLSSTWGRIKALYR